MDSFSFTVYYFMTDLAIFIQIGLLPFYIYDDARKAQTAAVKLPKICKHYVPEYFPDFLQIWIQISPTIIFII